MVCPGRDRIHGVVEIDETYVGGLVEGVAGRAHGRSRRARRNLPPRCRPRHQQAAAIPASACQAMPAAPWGGSSS
jgi:hypothetical protein